MQCGAFSGGRKAVPTAVSVGTAAVCCLDLLWFSFLRVVLVLFYLLGKRATRNLVVGGEAEDEKLPFCSPVLLLTFSFACPPVGTPMFSGLSPRRSNGFNMRQEESRSGDDQDRFPC